MVAMYLADKGKSVQILRLEKETMLCATAAT